MPVLACPGSAPIAGADKTPYSASSAAAAVTGATAQMQADADRDARFASRPYVCAPPTPGSDCRYCDVHASTAKVTPSGPVKVTHWSLINLLSRILGGSSDYTATVDYTWTATVTCDCR